MSSPDNVWAFTTLMAKAKRYEGIARGSDREGWLYPFWSTLALEALSRAALAHLSPVLLADGTDRNGHHLMYALGIPPQLRNYVPSSIPVSEVFRRCEELCDGFSSEQTRFCSGMSAQRNEELHSGGTPFSDLATNAWLPRFYQVTQILLVHVGENLESFFGDEADAAEQMILALEDEAAKSVNKAVSAHRTVWEEKTVEEREAASASAERSAKRSLGHVVSCPACRCKALLGGETIGTPTISLEDEALVERQLMLPTLFRCEACGLSVEGHSKLNAINLGGTFTRTEHYDPVDYYADAIDYERAIEAMMEPDFNE